MSSIGSDGKILQDMSSRIFFSYTDIYNLRMTKGISVTHL